MTRAARGGLVLGLALVACSESAVTPGGGGLAIQVVAADGVALVADQVRVHLEAPGQSAQIRTATPGTQETFENLDPGTYTVALEGLVGGDVEWFAEATVALQADQERTVSPTAQSFVPTLTDGASGATVPPQTDISFAWTPVAGAEEYRVEVDDTPLFTSPRVQSAASTNAGVSGELGTNYVRIRAVNRFGNLGVASETDVFTVSVASGSIAGMVTVEGQGVAGISVEAVGLFESRTVTTNAQGGFLFADILVGTYDVTISPGADHAFATTRRSVEVSEASTAEVSFSGSFVRTASILGRVTVDGVGLGNVGIGLSGPDGDQATTTDAAGNYTFASLRSGTYVVSITTNPDPGSYSFPIDNVTIALVTGQAGVVDFAGSESDGNAPPTASFTHSCTELDCHFDASGSSDPEGDIAKHVWSTGDGSEIDTGASPFLSHTYGSAGEYEVELVVTDSEGATGSTTRTLTANIRPNASFAFSCTDLTCAFDGSLSDDSDGTIVNYFWSFGDGNTVDSGLDPTVEHTYQTPGARSVTLVVTDDLGGEGSQTRQVSVAETEPTVSIVSITDGGGIPVDPQSIGGSVVVTVAVDPAGNTLERIEFLVREASSGDLYRVDQWIDFIPGAPARQGSGPVQRSFTWSSDAIRQMNGSHPIELFNSGSGMFETIGPDAMRPFHPLFVNGGWEIIARASFTERPEPSSASTAVATENEDALNVRVVTDNTDILNPVTGDYYDNFIFSGGTFWGGGDLHATVFPIVFSAPFDPNNPWIQRASMAFDGFVEGTDVGVGGAQLTAPNNADNTFEFVFCEAGGPTATDGSPCYASIDDLNTGVVGIRNATIVTNDAFGGAGPDLSDMRQLTFFGSPIGGFSEISIDVEVPGGTDDSRFDYPGVDKLGSPWPGGSELAGLAGQPLAGVGLPAEGGPADLLGNTKPITPLTDGVPEDVTSSGTNDRFYFSIEVPPGAHQIQMRVGDDEAFGLADAYLRYNGFPSPSSFDCAALDPSPQACAVGSPESGTWYVMLDGFPGGGLSLEVRVLEDGEFIQLQSGVEINVEDISSPWPPGKLLYYRIAVPPDVAMSINTRNGSGDLNVYARFGSPPVVGPEFDLEVYDHIGSGSGTQKSISDADAVEGDWWIVIEPIVQGFSGVTLIASAPT